MELAPLPVYKPFDGVTQVLFIQFKLTSRESARRVHLRRVLIYMLQNIRKFVNKHFQYQLGLVFSALLKQSYFVITALLNTYSLFHHEVLTYSHISSLFSAFYFWSSFTVSFTILCVLPAIVLANLWQRKSIPGGHQVKQITLLLALNTYAWTHWHMAKPMFWWS